MDLARRAERARERMGELGVDALLLSLGADLPWLTGYTAMPLERLTMFVLPREGDATLVVPRLEAPRVEPHDEQFDVRPWEETEDPIAIVAGLVGDSASLAVSDRAWAAFVLQLQAALPDARWTPASAVTGPLRAVKDAEEVDALARAGAAADKVAQQLLAGDIPLVGRTEAEVSRDIGDRRIERDEAVVCDFGGTFDGYCSDITRTVFTGPPTDEFREVYETVRAAQGAGVAAAAAGTPAEAVDGVARQMIAAAGYGEFFVHRTGHGIGMEEHEDPYLVQGNTTPLTEGHAFSVEPGVYLPDRFGVRIEDIVVVGDDGPRPLNHADHALTVVEG